MTQKPERDMDNTQSPTKPGLLRHAPLVIILLVAIIGFFTLKDYLSFETLRDNREALLAFRDSNFIGLAAAFIGIYIIIVAFSLPGAAVASVTGGFLFGLALGTTFNVIAASVGASAIFLAARFGLGRTLAAKMDASDGSLKKLKDGLRENEISVLFLLRLVPAVPFFVANLLPALVGVKFINFAFTTVLGIIPGALVFTWIGVGLGEVFDRGESPDLSILWEPQVIGPILGLCVLAALPIAIKAIRGKKDI
ncbi:MAG: TVP38/TMEM64 family protein [Pseudomonadota bacterium]